MIEPPLLFLDFDGVLHPAQGSAVPNFAYAAYVASAVEGIDCEVVVSSTWREHYTLSALRMMLPPPLAAKVIGCLGEDERGPHVRWNTIRSWLYANAPGRRWCAVDDSASEFPPGTKELLLCDGQRGFGPSEAVSLRRWLLSAS